MIALQILFIFALILIIIRSILSAIRDQKLINLSAQRLARQQQTKQPKQKIFEFIEDETEEDTAFGMPIDLLEENED